ncbi:MAG: type II secretion system protein GspL [Proteobacteria bacterium]|nr:type II secretion system protein GspL [Pseudomonadota bacterium]
MTAPSAAILSHTDKSANTFSDDGLASDRVSIRFIKKDGVVYAIVPNQHITLREIEIPTRSDAQARAAAPFVIEDEIAEDPAYVHVAVGPEMRPGTRLVAVVAHEQMAKWGDALINQEAGNAILLPESCAHKLVEGEAMLIDHEDSILLILHGGVGFAVEIDLFALVIERLIVESSIKSLTIYSHRFEILIPATLRGSLNINIQPSLSDVQYEKMLAAGLSTKTLNLRQGRYAPAMSPLSVLKDWKVPGALIGALALSYLLWVLLQAVQLSSGAEALRAETETIFRQALPDVVRMVNPRAQIQARLNESGGAGDQFLILSSGLFTALENTPGSRLNALQFNAGQGRLTATVVLPSYAEMESVRRHLNALDLKLEEGSTRSADNAVVSDLQVTRQ